MSTRSAAFWPGVVLTALLMLVAAMPGRAQPSPDPPRAMYDKIRSFGLTSPALAVENLLFKRDRAEMTFTGTFVFTGPVGDRVTGTVFQGQVSFRAPVPPSIFERENVRRLLKADSVESSFETAVMIFTDDTFQKISAGSSRRPGGGIPAEAQRLAADFVPSILRETGVNLAARAAASILNQEQPGFFCVQFDGGNRGRFSLLLDYQNRIPVAHFGLNGGEKGLIFSYRQGLYFNEIWMAFYGIEDYDRGSVAYSDTQDLVDIQHNAIDLDWFFNQWVMQVPLPSYRLEYTLEDQPGGAVILRGTVFQENAPDNWAMLLPVTFALGGNQVANTNIRAIGTQTSVTLKLPRRPTKVELDPDS